MSDWFPFIRSIHMLSGSLWIGELLIVNIILIPLFLKADSVLRNLFFNTIYPKLLTLTSVLSLIALSSGIFLAYYLSDGEFQRLIKGRWGLSILVGGSIGILLIIQHILSRKIRVRWMNEKMHHDPFPNGINFWLKVFPWMETLMLLVVFLLMMNASRGIW